MRGFSNPLTPVELVSFSANVSGNSVELNWETATELNNRGFEIQRKLINNFETIGFVPGFGSSSEPHSYKFIDDQVSSGNICYRLKQIDFDGSFSYSNLVEVNFEVPVRFNLEQNFPNPFNPSTTIQYSIPQKSNVTLIVYDILGNEVATLVNEEKISGAHTIKFDASGFASGMYLYRIKAGSFVETKKMILLK